MCDAQPRSIIILNHVAKLAPRVKQEVQTLNQEEDKVVVFNWDRGSSLETSSQRPWTEHSLDTDATIGFRGALLYIPWLYFRLATILLKRDADIVHFTHFVFLPLAPIAKIFQFSVVYDSYEFHALDISLRFPDVTQSWVNNIIENVENAFVHSVDCVLTIDSVDNCLVGRYQQACSNVVVLYNVPKKIHNKNQYHCISPQSNEDEKSYHLVYVGGISTQKGAVRAIRVAKKLQQHGYSVKLQFIGSIKGDKKWFHDTIQNIKKDNIIEYTPWLPYQKMISQIIGSDIALALHQPNKRFHRVSTGNGRKFFTYMQAGLPIVGPAFGEIGKSVAEAKCGCLVDTTDTESVVDTVKKMLDQPELRSEMGIRGRQAFESRFNWEHEREKLIRAYERI